MMEISIQEIRDMIEQAYMAGQYDNGAGVDPSYSDAQAYALLVIPEKEEDRGGVMITREEIMQQWDSWRKYFAVGKWWRWIMAQRRI